MLLEAVEKTEEELSSLRRKLMSQGLTAQQAHDQAWEMVREKYIFLPPEEHLEPPRNEANYRITPINAIGKGSLKRSSKGAARTSLPSACFAHSKRKSAQRPFDHW